MKGEDNNTMENVRDYIDNKCTVFEQNFQNMFIKELEESQIVAKSG